MPRNFIYILIFNCITGIVVAQNTLPLDLIVLSDSMYIQIEKKDKVRIYQKKSTLVLKPSANADAENILAEVYDKQLHLKNIEVLVKDTSGKQLFKTKKSDFKDIGIDGSYTMYSDSRFKTFKYTPVTYPYVIEKITETVRENSVFLPQYSLNISPKIYTRHQSLLIENETDIPIHFKKYNFDSYSLKEDVTPKRFNFVSENIIRKKDSLISDLPHIRFRMDDFSLAGVEGHFTNWQEFGEWYHKNILTGTTELPEEVKKEVKELVKNDTDTITIIRKIYQYMQARTRYISVQIGIGGWKPFPAKDVHRWGYGDCKGLSNYTRALLSVVGIQANYTIITADDEIKSFDKDFATMDGNHIILNVPLSKDTIWLECTSQDIAFNQLSDFTRDRYALSVNETGGTILKTPAMNEHTNQSDAKGTFTLTETGILSGEVELNSRGLYYVMNMKNALENSTEQEEYWKSQLDVSQMSMLNYTYLNDKDNAVVQKKLSFEKAKYAKLLGKDLISTALPIGRYRGNTSFSKDDHLTLNGSTMNSKFYLKVPEGYIAKDLPKKIEKNTAWGNYLLVLEQEGSVIKTERHIIIYYRSEKIPYNSDYIEFLNFVKRSDQTKLILSSSK